MTNPGKPAQTTSKYEEERLRAAEQSQFVYLQGQIDELRRLLKEQSNKYAWAMEQIRRVEASVSQIGGLLDRQRQEMAQTLDSYRRDITALRKEVAGALVKIDEGCAPCARCSRRFSNSRGATPGSRRDCAAFSRIDDMSSVCILECADQRG